MRPPRANSAALGRSFRYLGHYRTVTVLAYVFLIVSSAAMLVVPQLVQRIIDAITNGVTAQQIALLPAVAQVQALRVLGWTAEQLVRNRGGAEQALMSAGVLIVVFAIARGLFAFAQSYMA